MTAPHVYKSAAVSTRRKLMSNKWVSVVEVVVVVVVVLNNG